MDTIFLRRRPLALPALLACACGGAWAGGPGGVVLPPGTINVQPGAPVLDQRCVERVKGHDAAAARALHECRKPPSPGTPVPKALSPDQPPQKQP